jgi:hypothetical protein
MRVIINGGRQETITKSDLIAQGGEGMIFRDPGYPRSKALKIYHDPTKARARKLEAFFKAGLTLPDSVIAPMEIVTDESGMIIGFQMKWLSSKYSKLSMSFKRSFCNDHGLNTKTKVEMFSGIGDDLNIIHHQGLNIGPGIIVGDLNGGSIMISEKDLSRAWVDVDSWELNEKFPCVVGTQLYLCPELYGIDLSKSTPFKSEHDWWSFTVLLIQSLLNGVHPFKSGKHPDYKSVLTRAEHGVTVFDDDVGYPKIGLSPDVLTDELADTAIKILKRQKMGTFPKDVLRAYGDILTQCHSCGIWYPATRNNCPGCTQKTMLDSSMKTLVAGLQVVDLIITQGRILHYQKIGETLYCIADESGQLVLYTKKVGRVAEQTMMNKATPPGARFRFFENSMVICPDPSAQEPQLEIYEVGNGSIGLTAETTTELLSGSRAMFGCSPKRLYRIAGRYIMCGERVGSNLIERQVMQVFEGQTFFRVASESFSSRDIILGCHREFDQLNWFLIRSDCDGRIFNNQSVDLPKLESGESIADVEIYFSREEVLVIRKTRKKGIEFVRLETVSTEDGSVKNSRIVEVSNCPWWDNIHNKAFSLNFVMHPTDDGIIKEKISDGNTMDLPGTDQYVTSDNKLGRFDRGVMVVKEGSIVSIEPKKTK